MGNATIRVLPLNQPGPALAVWLAQHHPDLFVTVLKSAQSAQRARRLQLRGLGQDATEISSTDTGTTTTFDTASPDSTALQAVTVDTSNLDASLPSNLLSDSTSSGSNLLSSIGSGLTSAGSSVANTVGGGVSGLLSGIGSVASYVSSKAGLDTLGSIAKSYFAAQAADANAQTQQTVLQTQLARTAAGRVAAPITYTTGTNGQLVPVYATNTAQGTVYQPLSAAGLSALTPSAVTVFLSKYGLWIGLGIAALLGASALKR